MKVEHIPVEMGRWYSFSMRPWTPPQGQTIPARTIRRLYQGTRTQGGRTFLRVQRPNGYSHLLDPDWVAAVEPEEGPEG